MANPSILAVITFLCFFTVSIRAFDLSAALQDVAAHAPAVDKIINYIVEGQYSGVVYNRLAEFVDTLGPRFCGSEQLEIAVNHSIKLLEAEGFDNVHSEAVSLPQWVRGSESAAITQPIQKSIDILGLGYSIGTKGEPLTAEVLVVESFDELKQRASEAKGKIVVFNQQCDWDNLPIMCYGITGSYRFSGAAVAGQYGAVAALIRSLARYSLYTVHTGMMDGGASIPGACITVEDAELLARIAARNQTITITLSMEAQNLPSVTGHNVVAELKGSVYPEQTVLVSGHLDSWDITQGAMDDADGAMISWSVLSILKNLGIRPKRTVRFVAWSCEEMGGIGSQQYFNQHANEVSTMNAVFESDLVSK
jgi:carboxypeptidase Q